MNSLVGIGLVISSAVARCSESSTHMTPNVLGGELTPRPWRWAMLVTGWWAAPRKTAAGVPRQWRRPARGGGRGAAIARGLHGGTAWGIGAALGDNAAGPAPAPRPAPAPDPGTGADRLAAASNPESEPTSRDLKARAHAAVVALLPEHALPPHLPQRWQWLHQGPFWMHPNADRALQQALVRRLLELQPVLRA